MINKRPSIQILVVLIIAIPIVLLWISLTGVNNLLGHQIEDTMSSALARATAQQLRTQLHDQLVEAERMSDLYEYRFRTGVLPDAPGDQWISRFNESMRIRPRIASITFAIEDGRTVYAMRINQKLLIGRNFDASIKQISEYDIDEAGSINLNQPKNTRPYDPTKRPWYIDSAKSEGPKWTGVYAWFLPNRDISYYGKNILGLGYARKINKDSHGGVLMVDITLDSISDELAQSELAKLGSVILIDEQNRVIARSESLATNSDAPVMPTIASIEDDNARAVAKCVATGVDGNQELKIPELHRIVQINTIAPSSGLNWRMATVFPDTGVTGKISTMFKESAWIIALVALITLAIALWMTRWATRPISQLAEVARQMGQGNFDHQVKLHSTAEFEQLSEAFRSMAEGLKEQIKLRSQKEAAEHAVATRTAFFHRVTHEFRTPLNAIIGYSEMLDESPTVRNDPVVRDDLRKLRQASQNLLRLINDLLDLARIDSGRMTTEVSTFDLAKLLREVEEITKPLVVKNGNTLAIECDQETIINTDRQKLLQILLNLVTNAGKYTIDGTVTLSVVGNEAYIHIRIADTGQGMEPEKIKQMFEPFTRGNSGEEGTGLGLSISRQLTELLGGVIDLTSDLGKGTCVDLYFPCRPDGIIQPPHRRPD